MPTKPRLFLLDAGPLIELHRLGVWQGVIARAHVIVPGIIAEREAHFWDAGDGVGHPIDIDPDRVAGRIEVIHAEASEVAGVAAQFDATMRERVDAGELEALALLSRSSDDPPRFCSADRMAVVALCLLGFAHLAVSLEQLLREIGLQRRLENKYRQKTLRDWLEQGRQRRLRREGLV